MGCGCTMRGVRAGSRGLAGWAGSSVFSRWVSYTDSPLARRAGLSVAQHTTRCAGGSDSTHCHFETCPTSPLGQAPIPSLRHLAPPSTLPTQQLPRWQKTHPLLARRRGLGSLSSSCPGLLRSLNTPRTLCPAPRAWGASRQPHFTSGNPRGFCASFHFGQLLILSFPEKLFPINPPQSRRPRETSLVSPSSATITSDAIHSASWVLRSGRKKGP